MRALPCWSHLLLQLTILDLDNNQLVGTLPDLGSFTNVSPVCELTVHAKCVSPLTELQTETAEACNGVQTSH